MKKDLEKILQLIFNLALIFGIVYLAANDKDVWIWLFFVLVITA